MGPQVVQGDVIEVLSHYEAGSFDGCLTDPPYGLSFMGKQWDHGVPSADTWSEVLRVLRPGAPLLAFGGTRTYHRLACAIEDAGFTISDTVCWLHGQGFPKGKSQLKPAWEPITLAWKKGSRVLNIDGSRIGTQELLRGFTSRCDIRGGAYGSGYVPNPGDIPDYEQNALGRWPANLILDDESAAMLDAQSGTLKSGTKLKSHGRTVAKIGQGNVYSGGLWLRPEMHDFFGDQGGASRFFYSAKASRSERGEGNGHPCVKPIKLCEYLSRLILPPEGNERRLIVPFSGSGSEMIGAQQAGWDTIVGIEKEAAYVAMAEQRINERAPLFAACV